MMNDVLGAVVHAKVESGSLRGARGLSAPNLRKRDFRSPENVRVYLGEHVAGSRCRDFGLRPLGTGPESLERSREARKGPPFSFWEGGEGSASDGGPIGPVNGS